MRRRTPSLTFAALGVVFGDIGTSPLYALRECFGKHALPPTEANVLGVLSLVFWSLTIIVTIKYLLFVMRADNGGEGGILALVALVRGKGAHRALTGIGLFGAALLYGDGMITPAISVLSAVEGVNVATVALEPVVVPATVAILVALFAVQRRGTSGIGRVFGPIMVVWFAIMAIAGLLAVRDRPGVVSAINPLHAIEFLIANRLAALPALGAVFLTLTGAEALYADLGHFGRAPIRIAWFALVFPSLVLNYLGQGAALLAQPAARANPFYALTPGWMLYPMVALATVAAVIASQAIISGVFSMTHQVIQLGYAPHLEIRHTSTEERGQIYVPAANWALMVATVGLVLAFRNSTNLAGAYGMAVVTTMAATDVLAYAVARDRWRWALWRAGLVVGVFLAIDLVFFGANLIKIARGGWLPLLVAVGIYTIMTTWHTGRRMVAARLDRDAQPLDAFVRSLAAQRPARVPGAAVFLTSHGERTPPVLVHHLGRNKTLHEHVVLLTIETLDVPFGKSDDEVAVESLGQGIYRVVARRGFMQRPDAPSALKAAERRGLPATAADTTFYISHLTFVADSRIGMAAWRDRLFAFLAHNVRGMPGAFQIPAEHTVEIPIQLAT